jgi:hypothetical protein
MVSLHQISHFGGDSSPDQFLRRPTGLLHVRVERLGRVLFADF